MENMNKRRGRKGSEKNVNRKKERKKGDEKKTRKKRKWRKEKCRHRKKQTNKESEKCRERKKERKIMKKTRKKRKWKKKIVERKKERKRTVERHDARYTPDCLNQASDWSVALTSSVVGWNSNSAFVPEKSVSHFKLKSFQNYSLRR